MHEGSVYNLSFFEVVRSGKRYKTTKHEYKINFMYNTKVSEVGVGLVSGCPHSFVSFADILGNFDSDCLVGMCHYLIYLIYIIFPKLNVFCRAL